VLSILFAVFMMMGAWTAWRRNPMYSARSTLKSAAIVLMTVAGMVGIVVAAVNLTIGKSVAVAATTLGLVIVFGALGMIYIIQSVTVPKESKAAALPHSVKLVTTNRRKIYKWVKVFAVLIGGFALLGLLIPGNPAYAAYTLAGFTLFLAVILLPVMYWTSRGLDQSLTQTELNPWVHWQYTQEQWSRWCGVQVDRVKATPPTFVFRRDWHRLAWPIALISGGVYIFGPGSWVFKTIYIVAVCGALVALVLLAGRGEAHAGERLREKLLTAAPEVYFGRDGVFCDGVFTPWLDVSTYLISAAIDERQPRSLLFSFERSVPNPYGPTTIIPIHQSVLIPDAAGSDLGRLQVELTARCPTARVTIA
jgi:hypothetical protein